MNPRKLRLWLAVLLFLVAAALLLLSTAPFGRFLQELPLPPVILPTPVSLVLDLTASDRAAGGRTVLEPLRAWKGV